MNPLTTQINESKNLVQAWLAAIVESSDDAIISKDLNGIIMTWNRGAQQIFGYTADEVVGKSVTILMPPERVNEEPGILARIRAGERIDHYETIRRRKDGTLITISLTVSPIFDADGTVIGASKIARDITEIKELERVRRQSETMRNIIDTQEAERRRIARDLHDHVGQELTALRLQLAVARGRHQLSQENVRDLDTLSEIAERMDWDLGFLSWELRPTELEKLGIADALRSFVSEWARRNGIASACDCTLDGASTLPHHLETNIYRIVQEALNNIAKHADASHVDVTFRQSPGGDLELRISDNGRGLDPKRQANSKFSGFGLAGMRERAALFGGTMHVDSKGGQGTTISIRFPIDGIEYARADN